MTKNLRLLFLLVTAAFLATAGGCAAYRPLQIEPVSKQNAIVSPRFDTSYYYYNRDGTLFFVMRSNTTDKATGEPVEQIATVRVFWRPVGGVTSMNPTSLNATYRYVLITPDSVGMYEGAGFVRLWGKSGSKKISARIMDGNLRLTQASANFVDNLGRSRVRGNFSARYDDVKGLDMWLAAHREFYARSLLSKPAEAASTEPGTPPETEESAEPATQVVPPAKKHLFR